MPGAASSIQKTLLCFLSGAGPPARGAPAGVPVCCVAEAMSAAP